MLGPGQSNHWNEPVLTVDELNAQEWIGQGNTVERSGEQLGTGPSRSLCGPSRGDLFGLSCTSTGTVQNAELFDDERASTEVDRAGGVRVKPRSV